MIKSLLENKIKYNEHETHLKDLEIQRMENLIKAKEENLMAQLDERTALYEKQIQTLEIRNQEERKIIETDMNKKMEEINLNYQMKMQDQKSIIKQYETKLLELEKELRTKKKYFKPECPKK